MPSFVLNLRHNSEAGTYIAEAHVVGANDGKDYREGVRHFDSTEDIAKALEAAGIAKSRYADAVESIYNDYPGVAIEISQNEAQKLDVLQTDTAE